MSTHSRIVRPVGLALVAFLSLLLISGCGGGGTDADTAASVGDETISRTLVDAYARDIYARSARAGEPSAKELADLRQQALRQLIVNAELRLEAKRTGVTISDEQVDQKLYAASGGDPLAAAPTELERVQARDQLVQDALRERVGRGLPTPTQAAIERFYDKHPELFHRPASRPVVYLRATDKATLSGLLDDGPRTDLTTKIGSPDVTGGAITYMDGTDADLDAQVMSGAEGVVIGPVKDSTGAYALIQPRGPLVKAQTPTLTQAREQVAALLREQGLSKRWNALTEEVGARYRAQVTVAEDLQLDPVGAGTR